MTICQMNTSQKPNFYFIKMTIFVFFLFSFILKQIFHYFYFYLLFLIFFSFKIFQNFRAKYDNNYFQTFLQ